MRELLDEERALVKAFQKRVRELAASEGEAEREGYKRRVAELEAEAKMLKTFAETQIEEGRQAHAREVEIMGRRAGDLEEEKRQLVRSWEGRLAEAHGRRTAELADKERQLLEAEDAMKLELAEARRQAEQAHDELELAAARAGRGGVDAQQLRALEQQLDAEREAVAVAQGRALAAEQAAEQRAEALRAEMAASAQSVERQIGRLKERGQVVRSELIAKLTRGNAHQLLRHTLSQWITFWRRQTADRHRDRSAKERTTLEAKYGATRAELEARIQQQQIALEHTRHM